MTAGDFIREQGFGILFDMSYEHNHNHDRMIISNVNIGGNIASYYIGLVLYDYLQLKHNKHYVK
jgi:hypothetical protein